MPNRDEAADADFEQASETLTEGLKSCRAVVRNYRQMLAEDAPPTDGSKPRTNGPAAN